MTPKHTTTVEEGKPPIGYPNKFLITDYDAYRILEMAGCPIRLPKARSMTQAAMDLDHLKPAILQWYTTQTSKQ